MAKALSNRNTLENYPREDKPETESKTWEVLSQATQPIRTVAGKKFFFSNMLEEILDIRNVTKALKQVTANKGAGGIDGMQTPARSVQAGMNFATTSTPTGKR